VPKRRNAAASATAGKTSTTFMTCSSARMDAVERLTQAAIAAMRAV